MVFLGRKAELQQFQEFLQGKSDDPWVMIITGMECIGKSHLLKQMEKNCPEDIPHLYLDFVVESLPTDRFYLNILEKLAYKISPYCDEQKFKIFQDELDEAKRYMAKIVSDAADQPLNQSIIIDHGSTMERNRISLSGLKEIIYLGQSTQINILKTAIRDLLQSFRPDRFLILLDNLERLHEHENQENPNAGDWLMNTLLPEIYDILRPRQCFVIVTSRTSPRLEAIQQYQRIHITLPFIHHTDITAHLEQIQIPHSLHHDICELTSGHGLCFTIFCDIIQNERLHDEEDFSRLSALFDQRAWMEFVHQNILSRLRPPFNNLMLHCMDREYFNLPMLREVLLREASSKPLTEIEMLDYFTKFILHPSITKYHKNSKFYSVNPLLRTLRLRYTSEKVERPRDIAKGSNMSQKTPRPLFVGRKQEIAVYQMFLHQNTSQILLITGMAGSGKSRLLNYLIENPPLGITPIKLDFANRSLQVEPSKILEELSWKTKAFCDPQLAENFISVLQKARKQLTQQGSEKIQVLSTNNQIQLLDSETQQDIHQNAIELRQEILEALYAQLATYRREHLIIMFDTCEWLNESEDNEIVDWFKDDLIPGLCQHLRIPFHIVLASRTRPQLQSIEQSDQQLELSPLAEEAVNEYLQSIAKYDQQLGKNIYQITKGHPLCISIIGTLLQEDSAFTLDNFEGLEQRFTERAMVEFIQERLDSHLQSPFRELTHYGILLRSFDWELLRRVFYEFLSEPNSYHHFERLIRYSHVEEIVEGFEDRKDKCYSIHILLREILVENIRVQEPTKWQMYHQRAYEYYADLNKAEQYYHAIALDEDQGIMAWKEAVLKALGTESSYLHELIPLPHDQTLKLSTKGNAIYHATLGQYRASLRKWEEALEDYDQALAIFNDLADKLNMARILQAISQVKSNQALALQTIGRAKLHKQQRTEALQSYEQAYTIFDELGGIENQLNKAHVLQAMGNIKLQYRKQWKFGLDDYKQAISLFQKVLNEEKEPSNSAKYLQSIIQIHLSIGDTYQQHKKWDLALESYQEALQQYQQLNRNEVETYLEGEANIHAKIGEVHEAKWKLTIAKDHYQRSLTLFQLAKDSNGESKMQKAINDALLPLKVRSQLLSLQGILSIILLLCILFGSGYYWYQSTNDPCLPTQSPPQNIGTIQTLPQCGQETIGVSDGTASFDEGQSDRDQKVVAAIQQMQGKPSNEVLQSWKDAIKAAPNDAEALIYLEDLNVINSGKPYITFAVATILTPVAGSFIGGGRDILQGAYVAQKEHNDHCSTSGSNCPQVRLLVANSGSNPSYATFVAKQIVNIAKTDSTFLGVMGWLNSTPTRNAIQILDQAHIPMISSTASSDTLSGISPYFFRLAPPDRNQGKAGAQYAREQLQAQNVAIFSDPSDAYSESLAAAFQSDFQSSGGNVLVTEQYTVGSSNNLLKDLNDALQRKPDLIYFAGYAKDISTLLVNLNSSSTTVKIMGGDALYIPNDYTQTTQGNTEFQYLYFTAFAHPNKLQNTLLHPFLKEYQQDFNVASSTNKPPTGDIILTYDTVNTLIVGYQKALPIKTGDKVTPEELRRGLSKIDTHHPLSGISGQIAFQPNGDPANKTILVLNGLSINQECIQAIYPPGNITVDHQATC